MKKLFSNLTIAFIGGLMALFVNQYWLQNNVSAAEQTVQKVQTVYVSEEKANPTVVNYKHSNSNTNTSTVVVPSIDFTGIAENSTPAVVHIKTKISTQSLTSPIEEFFGLNPNDQQEGKRNYASGSGVIVDPNGYIVTNFHVIEDADEVEVILNDKRSFIADILGYDESTDLAVLRVNVEEALPYVSYGNSDNVKIGEWVMAVGNPFNLASTVTVGIVSAKARNIDILEGSTSIESFIQTDAAVNSGNSGGALIDLNGNLIGINTAIATPTGYFAGYSFAVPVNIVKKVTTDIIEYGEVQRGFLGVSIVDVDSQVAKRLGLNTIEGVYVSSVSNNSAAEKAGISAGDIITKIENVVVNSAPELQEMVSRFRPNDNIRVVFRRNGTLQEVQARLQSNY